MSYAWGFGGDTTDSADATASLQTPGGIGAYGYVSSKATTTPVTLRFDDLSAFRP